MKQQGTLSEHDREEIVSSFNELKKVIDDGFAKITKLLSRMPSTEEFRLIVREEVRRSLKKL